MGKKLLVALIACTVTTFANAGVLNWAVSYSGAGVSADIVLTTTDTLSGGGFYEITAISGTRNGATIDALLSAGSHDSGHGTEFFSDNELFPVEPHLGVGGFTFEIMGELYNLYFNHGDTDLYYDVAGPTWDGGSLGTEVDVQFAQLVVVPEPASLALFGLCAAALGFSRRKHA